MLLLPFPFLTPCAALLKKKFKLPILPVIAVVKNEKNLGLILSIVFLTEVGNMWLDLMTTVVASLL